MPIERGPSIPRVVANGVEISPAIHPKHAFIKPDGHRDLDAEASVYEREDGAIVYSDVIDRREPVAVVIELPAEGIEWLLDELTARNYARDDRFFRLVSYARDLAKVIAWDRAVGR